MQVSLIGLRHLEQARIPISARLNSGSGWMDGMMLALDQAGARHSQCLYGTVMENSMLFRVAEPVVNIGQFLK
jgi:hypothetical protein